MFGGSSLFFIYLVRFYMSFRYVSLMRLPPSSSVSPIAVPTYKGTHGDCVAGGNTQHSHNKYRSLIMPLRFVCLLRNNTAQSLVLFVKLGVRYGRRHCGSDYVPSK